MAEINTPAAAGNKPGARRGKKLSTRVDLTPMVDLGFLLITFFIFTTAMSEPAAMKIFMPADSKERTPSKESESLTVMPMADNKVFYFHGSLENALRNGNYGTTGYHFANGIGQVIRGKQTLLRNSGVDGARVMLIIKPFPSSNFQNLVDIIDEVTINDVKSYALTDVSSEEMVQLRELKL